MPDPRTLTARFVDHVKPAPKGKRAFHWDRMSPGLALRVTDSGHRSWVVQKRLNGTMKRWTLGPYVPASGSDPAPRGSIAWARHEAHDMLAEIARGIDPKVKRIREERERVRQLAGTIEATAADFVKKYAKRHNRSWKETERIFRVYVTPRWKGRSLFEISRLDVTELLDAVEDDHGPVMADRTLAVVRKLFNWYATRDDHFISPIVKGMARTKPKARARDRVLTDAEIRALWSSLDGLPLPFAGIVRTLLLTAQRRSEVAGMSREEISEDGGAWTIPAVRYKTKLAHVVPVTQEVRAIIAAQPRFVDAKGKPKGRRDFVFTTGGDAPFAGFSKAKSELDAKILSALQVQAGRVGAEPPEKLHPWTLHDLRRTAKTLMTRAGVPHFIADRVLGHVIPGVGGVYDRHSYFDEKKRALETLTATVERILSPPLGNVVPLGAAGTR